MTLCSIISLYLVCGVCCSDNYVGALGAAVLSNALKTNKSLKELHIKGNELGNEGIKVICTALSQRQTTFKALDAGNNRYLSKSSCNRIVQKRLDHSCSAMHNFSAI